MGVKWYWLCGKTHEKEWLEVCEVRRGESVADNIEKEYQDEMNNKRGGYRVYHYFGDRGSACIDFKKMETFCGSAKCQCHFDDTLRNKHMVYKLKRVNSSSFEEEYVILRNALEEGNRGIDWEIKEIKEQIKKLKKEKRSMRKRSLTYRCEAFENEYETTPRQVLKKYHDRLMSYSKTDMTLDGYRLWFNYEYDIKKVDTTLDRVVPYDSYKKCLPTEIEVNAYRAVFAKEMELPKN